MTNREPFLAKRSERLFGLPLVVLFILLLVLGNYSSAPVQGLLWTTAFAMVAARCLWHSWRCARMECLITGPLYGTLAVLSAVLTLGAGITSWSRIWLIFYIGTGVAFLGGFLLSSRIGTKYMRGLRGFVDHRSTIAIWAVVVLGALIAAMLSAA